MAELPFKPSKTSWAIVETGSYSRTAGLIQEAIIAGTKFLRIDTPLPHELIREGMKDEFLTRYYRGEAVFSITPCSEQVARMVAKQALDQSHLPFHLKEHLAMELSKAGENHG